MSLARYVQAADLGEHRSPESGRLSSLATHLPALLSGTLKASCLENLNWMLWWENRERDARVGALQGRGGWPWLSGVATASPAIAIPPTAVSRPGRRSGGGGVFSPLPLPVYGVSALCPLRGGLRGGREGVGTVSVGVGVVKAAGF